MWCFRPYKPHIFYVDMILASCHHHHILIWWSSYTHIIIKQNRPNTCYIFEKEGTQGYQLWYSGLSFLSSDDYHIIMWWSSCHHMMIIVRKSLPPPTAWMYPFKRSSIYVYVYTWPLELGLGPLVRSWLRFPSTWPTYSCCSRQDSAWMLVCSNTIWQNMGL